MHRAVEDLVERAEILAYPVRLAYHVIEKVQIGIGRAREVMHRHVAGLPVAVDAAVALLQPRRIPGAVVVKEIAGSAVKVEAFGRGVRGDEHPHRRRRIVERGLHVLPVALVHAAGAAAAEQREDAIIGVAFPEAPGQVVQGGLVLREDDQAFVGPERRFVPRAAAGATRGPNQQSVDERQERVEPRIRYGCLLGNRRIVQVESEHFERALDVVYLCIQLVGEVSEPGAGNGRGRGFALLGFAVVTGLLAQRAFHRRHVLLGSRFRTGESLPRPTPGVRKRRGAGEQPLAEDLDRERAGPASGSRTP